MNYNLTNIPNKILINDLLFTRSLCFLISMTGLNFDRQSWLLIVKHSWNVLWNISYRTIKPSCWLYNYVFVKFVTSHHFRTKHSIKGHLVHLPKSQPVTWAATKLVSQHISAIAAHGTLSGRRWTSGWLSLTTHGCHLRPSKQSKPW